MFNKLPLAVVSAIFCFTPLSVLAYQKLDDVVVTANRSETSFDNTLAAVNIISGEDIRKSTSKNLADLLSKVSGIDFTKNGEYGKPSSIFIRGTNSSHVLVLIDGVKVGSATLGYATFEHMPLSQIEKIEIVKGPRSSIYGSEAIGGVIQVFTKRGGKDNKVTGSFGFGNNSAYETQIGIFGSKDKTKYALSASKFDTDGINSISSNNADEDGYDNLSVNGNIQHIFSDGSAITFGVLRSQGTNEYDSQWDAASIFEADFVQQSACIKYDRQITSIWNGYLQYSNNKDESENFTSGASTSFSNTDKEQVLLHNELELNNGGVILAGLEYSKSKVNSNTRYSVDNLENSAVYLQFLHDVNSSDISLSLRRDKNDGLNYVTTGSFALGFELSEGYRTFMSYGKAYKTPSLNDLFWPADSWSQGNPNLLPEESDSIELSFLITKSMFSGSMNIYQTEIDNLISWGMNESFVYIPNNVAEAKITGAELEVGADVLDWVLTANYSWCNPKDKSTDNLLPRRSKRKGRVSFERTYQSLDFNFGYRYFGKSFNDADNTTDINSYGLFDAAVDYKISNNISAELRVDNISDKDYETVSGYNNLGRNMFFTIRLED